jgi:emp24/gp25L/p24 family/GOLD
MSITYQVSGGGHLDIDVWLTDPDDVELYSQRKKDTGTYSFTADKECVCFSLGHPYIHIDPLDFSGRYDYCFSNEMSSVAGKTVSFNVHGVLYVDDDGTELSRCVPALCEVAVLTRRCQQTTWHRSKRRFELSLRLSKPSRMSKNTLLSANVCTATVSHRPHIRTLGTAS